MAFHFYVMNNILYLIESFQATKYHHHHHPRCSLHRRRRHHHHRRRHPTTIFFARRLPPVAFSLSPIRFCAQEMWIHLFNIFRIVLFSSSRHFVFGRSFVSCLALVLNQSSSSLYFHTKLVLENSRSHHVMCMHGVCKRHITASLSSIVLWSFIRSTTPTYTHTHTHTLHA